MRIDTFLVLGPDLIAQRVGLLPRVGFECFEPGLHVLSELVGLLAEPLFQAGEPSVEFAQLAAEQESLTLSMLPPPPASPVAGRPASASPPPRAAVRSVSLDGIMAVSSMLLLPSEVRCRGETTLARPF